MMSMHEDLLNCIKMQESKPPVPLKGELRPVIVLK